MVEERQKGERMCEERKEQGGERGWEGRVTGDRKRKQRRRGGKRGRGRRGRKEGMCKR